MENTAKTKAEELVRKYAEENEWAVRKDVDALLECGEVDSETVWSGYLADAVLSNEEVAEIEEEVYTALVDFYCDQMDGLYEEEEEESDPITIALVAEFVEYAGNEIPLTDALIADLQDTYTRLVADGCEDAMAEAVHIVADAN